MLTLWTLLNWMHEKRSSTKWKFLFATNVTFLQLCWRATLLVVETFFCQFTSPNVQFYLLHLQGDRGRNNDKLCFLGAVCMYRTGTEKLQEETSLLNAFLKVNSNSTLENFWGIALKDLHIVERLAKGKISVYNIEVSDIGTVGELAQRSLPKSNTTIN